MSETVDKKNLYEWYADLGIHSVKTGYAGGLPNGHNHHGQFPP